MSNKPKILDPQPFKGATDSSDGKKGVVPAPVSMHDDQNYVLSSDGTWKEDCLREAEDYSERQAALVTANTKEYADNKFLPLSGNEPEKPMTGDIVMSDRHSIKCSGDGDYIRIIGGTDVGHGCGMDILGKDYPAPNSGCFYLHPADGVKDTCLVGRPNGSLTWGSRELVQATYNTTVTASWITCFVQYSGSQCKMQHPFLLPSVGCTWTVTNINGSFVRYDGTTLKTGASLAALGASIYFFNPTYQYIDVNLNTGFNGTGYFAGYITFTCART